MAGKRRSSPTSKRSLSEMFNLIEAHRHWSVAKALHRQGDRLALGYDTEASRLAERSATAFTELFQHMRGVSAELTAALKEIKALRPSAKLGQLMVENKQLIIDALRGRDGMDAAALRMSLDIEVRA